MSSRREVTHRPNAVFGTFLGLTLFASACGQQTPPDNRAADEAAIRAADAQWSKTAAAKDLEGTVSYYADDATVLPPNAPMATDKHAIRAVWAPLVAPGIDTYWQVNRVEVSRSGELGYVVGVYRVTAKDAQGKPSVEHGKLVEVWKKQADGKWKCVADIFNSDDPLPASPPKM